MKSCRIILLVLLALPCYFTQDEGGESTFMDSEPAPDGNEVDTESGGGSKKPVSKPKKSPSSSILMGASSKGKPSFGSDQEAEEFRDVKVDSKTVCDAMSAKEEQMKIDLNGYLNYEDMLKLMTWSLKYDLKSGRKHLKVNSKIKWKREIVELISTIFKKGCPSIFVPEEFINIAKEVGMIYLNSVAKSQGQNAKWNSTINTLRACAAGQTELKFTSRGFRADFLRIKNQRGYEETVEILPPMEIADTGLPYMDLVVDTLWWMFSFSFGSCYPLMDTNSKLIDLAQYKKLFYNDFLLDLIPRWKQGGRWPMAYGPIFGNMNIPQAIVNIRYCVTAAYVTTYFADRQLVRPLGLAIEPSGPEVQPNIKTGEAYH